MSLIIQIYVVTIWILVGTSILLAISNMMLWSHLQKMKQERQSDLMRIASQLLTLNSQMNRILREVRKEEPNGQIIPMWGPRNDNSRTTD